MLKQSVSVEIQKKNLIYFSKKLKNIDYFVFFGTLLGLVREGNIIQGDDDIDLYVNVKDKKNIFNILKNSPYKKTKNSSDYFLQFKRKYNNESSIVDIYFYEDLNKDYIKEKHNFFGLYKYSLFTLHIPKKIIFPIQIKNFFNVDIKLPSKPKMVCSFLYSQNWKIKLSKEKYKMLLIFHKPFFHKNKILHFFLKKTLRFLSKYFF